MSRWAKSHVILRLRTVLPFFRKNNQTDKPISPQALKKTQKFGGDFSRKNIMAGSWLNALKRLNRNAEKLKFKI
jgi:hypothetical protein